MSRSSDIAQHGFERPETLQNSKSFSRIEPKISSPLRSRASTLSHTIQSEMPNSHLTNGMAEVNSKLEEDIFEKSHSPLDSNVNNVQPLSPQELPQDFDELPIELLSLIDRYEPKPQSSHAVANCSSFRFLESLTVKAHNTPPSIERISQRFQDFYVEAGVHITTHIKALSTRQARGSSPSPSISSKTSLSMKDRLRTSSSGDSLAPLEGSIPEQQMLTPLEISERRKARRLLEQKRLALEEAVERRVCDKIYSRIWRHRSTLDEVRDEKLRSRTAALLLVGIGLPDLGVTFDKASSGNGPDPAGSIEHYISRTREELLAMNNVRWPQGKLQHLAAAHKSIVDLLTNLHQSSSSADEILPTLIYALITSPPSGMNIISNLHFTQNFRNASKIDGEAAYCLTNLEAAISFLETVDLASLRSDEPLEGPPKSPGRQMMPSAETPTEVVFSPVTSPLADPLSSSPHPLSSPPSSPVPSKALPTPRSPSHSRRVSDLFNPSTSALSTASNTVRTTADQGLKNITTTLDNSFKFLFGRLSEQQVTSPNAAPLPRTLDDARKLVDPKSVDEDEPPASGASSIAEQQMDGPVEQAAKSDDKLLGFFAGRPQPRDRSVDSTLSSGSGKRVAFAPPSPTPVKSSVINERLSESPQAAVNSPIESMRSFGNSINPLKGFGGMNVMRGFGRAPSAGKETPTLGTGSSGEKVIAKEKVHRQELKGQANPLENGGIHGDGVKERSATKNLVGPPIQRFLDVADEGDLRVGEIRDLLADYRRLVGVLKEMNAFQGV